MLIRMRGYSLVLFFLLAFALTWLRWLPEAASARGWLDFEVPLSLELLGGYGPLIAAVLVTGLFGGWSALKDLGARLVRWRVGLRWYLIVLFLPILTNGLGLLIFSLAFRQPLSLSPDRLPALNLLLFFPVLLLGFDGLGEELGWRGYALPALLTNRSPLVASLILGLLWGFWHLPYALTPSSFIAQTPFLLVIANTMGLAILHTWIFTHTRRSIFLAILFHAWNNMVAIIMLDWLPVYGNPEVTLFILLVQWALVAVVLLVASPFRLGRSLEEEIARDTDFSDLHG